MLTIKFYADGGFRQKIVEAESITVLRPNNGDVEITCHGIRLNGGNTDQRFDLTSRTALPRDSEPDISWERAIVENANGRTTEIFYSDDAFQRRAA